MDKPPILARDLFGYARLQEAIKLADHPLVRELTDKYRPWRKFRPIAREARLDPDVAWVAAKWRRMFSWRTLDLSSPDGTPFVVFAGGGVAERLHRLDRETGGGGSVALDHSSGVLADEEAQRRFLIRSMMDEAIDSSIIEGAKTSIQVARELLRSGREPKDKSERMVRNNYAAMSLVKRLVDKPLTVEMLIELQRTLTEGALDDHAAADGSGRLRRPEEKIIVEDLRTKETIHTPPAAELLPERLKRLCEFANAPHSGDRFLHPIIKACILHFMIGYEHPFVDGNGRTARAVFYWCAMRHGYRIVEFLSISALIRAATAKYPQAYIDCETDDNDLTYFVLYKLDIIRRALDALAGYVLEEEQRIEASVRLLKLDSNLNLRQRLLLEHALKHPTTRYTAKSQANTNGVSIMTARTDLEQLRDRGFLQTFKEGKAIQYVLDPAVAKRLAKRKERDRRR